MHATAIPQSAAGGDVAGDALRRCRELLARFYRAEVPPELTALRGEDVPAPQRRLLVHTNDMTPTLEAYYGQEVRVQALDTAHDGGVYGRMVLLLTAGHRPAGFGAIRVHSEHLPEDAFRDVLEARRPLGGILIARGIAHTSNPLVYFALAADRRIARALECATHTRLYGRGNILATPTGAAIAEVVEIMPSFASDAG
jgi:chorismate-pyruvate lyase